MPVVQTIFETAEQVPRWVLPFKPGKPVAEGVGLPNLYDYAVRHWPDKWAIKDGLTAYTFRQLHTGAHNLASLFGQLGVVKGDRIMVIAEKRAAMAIIGAAIWKAGGVYVPIDPANPAPRDEYLFRSIQPKVLVAPNRQSIKMPVTEKDCAVVYFDEVHACCEGALADNAGFPLMESTDLAYIMHTSGSTGDPKGVMIEHGSVTDYFYNHNLVLRFTETSYCLSNAPFYFDVSIEDTFLPLSTGACVYQYRGLPVSALVLNLLYKEKITHLIAVSTVLTLITGDGQKLAATDLSSLEMVMTGAEVCDVKIINAWKEAAPGARIINVYGPTETTIVCTAYTVQQADTARNEFYPIGKPLENVLFLLLDEAGNVIRSVHQKGELLIGGRQVMRGYWKDEVLTEKVLVSFDDHTYYRTGDMCYLDDNADLVFCGREDDEIKLAGRRINLIEIKRKLLDYQGVKSVAVGVVTIQERRTMGAVIALPADLAGNELLAVREYLMAQLPQYMVPEYIGVINDPALAATGKHDDKKLMAFLQEAIEPQKGGFYIMNKQGRFTPLNN